MGATLSVMRVRNRELHFVLHEAQKAAVLEGRTPLSRDLLAQIDRSYNLYAECVKGFEDDEPHFRKLGMAFCAILLPSFVQAQIRQRTDPLTILTNEPALPWEIMHDGEDFLALRMPLSRVLVVQSQLRSLLRPIASERQADAFSALIIADPTEDLEGARVEGEALHALLRRRGHCDLLRGRDASFENITTSLVSRSYAVIHFCGHVDYDPRRRSSSIRLQSGSISADNVVRLFRGSPVVFLNACHSDKSRLDSPQTASARIENFAQAFMFGSEQGVASAVVGTMWRVPDEPKDANREFVLTFYRHLLKGGAIGEAMRVSRLHARRKKWGPMVWGPYVLYGDPTAMPLGSGTPAPPAQPEPHVEEAAASSMEATEREAPRDPSAKAPVPGQDEPRVSADATPTNRAGATDTHPLDTAAREVFHIALREMMLMDQGALSSMHMLIGFVQVVDLLKALLAEKKIEPEQICEQARERARELLPALGEGFGISNSVEQILLQGTRRAKLFSHGKITAEDLLAGLLRCQDAEAASILTKAGVPLQEVAARLPPPPPIPKEWFDAPMQEALLHATKCAARAHLDFVATPHLVVGMIRTAAPLTSRLLRERGLNLEQLCDALLALVGEGTSKDGNGHGERGLLLHPRTESIFHRAREFATQATSVSVAEPHLLRAILEQQGSSTLVLLRRFGADPRSLLIALERSSPAEAKSPTTDE